MGSVLILVSCLDRLGGGRAEVRFASIRGNKRKYFRCSSYPKGDMSL